MVNIVVVEKGPTDKK